MSKPTDTDARILVQDVLDRLDNALITHDFEAYSELLHVPHHVRTKTEVFDARSMQELRVVFDRFCEYAREHDAAHCERICQTASFRNRDRIETTFTVSYYKHDGSLCLPTTLTTSILMRIGTRWQICGSDNSTRISTGIADALRKAVAKNTNWPARPGD